MNRPSPLWLVPVALGVALAVSVYHVSGDEAALPPDGDIVSLPQPAPVTLTPTPVRLVVPDPKLTPGDTLPQVKEGTVDQTICIPGWSKKHRHVKRSQYREAEKAYGVHYTPKAYELDHLVSLELGGSNRQQNLWPEPRHIKWGAETKDALENRLHRLVCSHQITLAEAQTGIAADWIAAYQEHMP